MSNKRKIQLQEIQVNEILGKRKSNETVKYQSQREKDQKKHFQTAQKQDVSIKRNNIRDEVTEEKRILEKRIKYELVEKFLGQTDSIYEGTPKKNEVSGLAQELGCSNGIHDEYLYLEDIYREELIRDKKHSNLYKVYGRDNGLAKCRKILIEWLLEIQLFTKTDNTILYSAIGIFDILLNKKLIPGSEMQMAVLVCFWIAVKTHNRRKLEVKTIKNLLGGGVQSNTILSYERMVLKTLNFNVLVRDPVFMLTYLHTRLPRIMNKELVVNCSQYLLEVMMIESEFLKFSYSTTVYTAFYTSLNLFNMDKYLIFYKNCYVDDEEMRLTSLCLMNAISEINRLVKHKKPPAVFKKYKKKCYGSISLHNNISIPFNKNCDSDNVKISLSLYH